MPSFTATKARRNSRLTRGCSDGNIYPPPKNRRIRGKALFREDNSTFTLGGDKKYYFVFTLPEAQADSLPDTLVLQALAIAQKVSSMLLNKNHKRPVGK